MVLFYSCFLERNAGKGVFCLYQLSIMLLIVKCWQFKVISCLNNLLIYKAGGNFTTNCSRGCRNNGKIRL